jgi:hypothetical protein
LSRGSAEGVRRLQGMASPHAAVAAPAAADVNVELPMNRPAWNFNLVLLVDMRFGQGTAAVGTGIWQRRLVGLIDVFRRLAMGLDAVIFAGLAAGLLGFGLRGSLGKRRGLAFADTALFVEQPGQVLDLGAQLGHLASQTKAVQTRGCGHTFTLASRRVLSCATLARTVNRTSTDGTGGALIKYR